MLTGSTLNRFLATGIVEFGEENAEDVLTIFTEAHCAYCREFHTMILPKIREEFVATGAMRVRVVPFVLQKYVNSPATARALICAGIQGNGGAMLDRLMTREATHPTSLLTYAEELEMEQETFQKCMESDATRQLLEKHQSIAKQLEVALVPTFFLNGERQNGLPIWPELRGWIRLNTQ